MFIYETSAQASGVNDAGHISIPAAQEVPVANNTQVEQNPGPTQLVQIKEVANKINKFVEGMTTELEFSVDVEATRIVVKVVDKATREIIHQMSLDGLLVIARRLDDRHGLIIRQLV